MGELIFNDMNMDAHRVREARRSEDTGPARSETKAEPDFGGGDRGLREPGGTVVQATNKVVACYAPLELRFEILCNEARRAKDGAPGRNRTRDLRFTKPVTSPNEPLQNRTSFGLKPLQPLYFSDVLAYVAIIG
ncbi:hypothetical protein ACWGS9_19960 [Bradyrhizobium sp. Arg314]